METVEDFLEHYGVKGMRWGKTTKSAGSPPKERGTFRKAITRGRVQREAVGEAIREKGGGPLFADSQKRMEFRGNVHANTASRISDLKNDSRFKGKDLKYDKEARAAYHTEVKSHAKKAYQEELNIARAGLAIDVAVGLTQAVRASRQAKQAGPSQEEQIRLQAMMRDIQHAADDKIIDEMTLTFDRDEQDFIVNLQVSKAAVQHSDTDEVGDFLEHYGVKGMKWGVSKRDTSPVAATVSQPKPGRKVKAKGGENQPASEDAKLAAAARQTARKSTTDALSNQELQALVNRMNLEQQYSRLAAPPKTAGQKFAEAFLGDLAKRKVSTSLDEIAEKDPKHQQVADAFRKTAGLGKREKKEEDKKK